MTQSFAGSNPAVPARAKAHAEWCSVNGVLLTATVGYLTVAHQKIMKMYIYAIGVHTYMTSAVLLKDGIAKCGIELFFKTTHLEPDESS